MSSPSTPIQKVPPNLIILILFAVMLLAAGPDVLTFMPEISLIGAFSVATLRGLEKDATGNLKKMYSEAHPLSRRMH